VDKTVTFTDKIILFPNPAGDFLNVKTEKFIPQKYEIVNVLGEKISSEAILGVKTEFQIDLKNLVSGIYFLILANDKGENLIRQFVR
jgi:hypothetical protein